LATNHPENTSLAVCQRKMDSKMFEHLKCLFNTAYYIAKFNKPLTDFKNLIALLNKHDVDKSTGRAVEEYQNDMKCKESVSVSLMIVQAKARSLLTFILRAFPHGNIILRVMSTNVPPRECKLWQRCIIFYFVGVVMRWLTVYLESADKVS
jgi:hypothetical protein